MNQPKSMVSLLILSWASPQKTLGLVLSVHLHLSETLSLNVAAINRLFEHYFRYYRNLKCYVYQALSSQFINVSPVLPIEMVVGGCRYTEVTFITIGEHIGTAVLRSSYLTKCCITCTDSVNDDEASNLPD